MTDRRNLKTSVFTADLPPLFTSTPFFFFDVETMIANVNGIVLREGRYILITESSFKFLGNRRDGSEKRAVQPYQMIKRALSHDPTLTVTASKRVMHDAPFNFRYPEVPRGCHPLPSWHTKSSHISLVNVNALVRVLKHFDKNIMAFGESINPLLVSGGYDYRDQLLKFMTDAASGTILKDALASIPPAIQREFIPRSIDVCIRSSESSIPTLPAYASGVPFPDAPTVFNSLGGCAPLEPSHYTPFFSVYTAEQPVQYRFMRLQPRLVLPPAAIYGYASRVDLPYALYDLRGAATATSLRGRAGTHHPIHYSLHPPLCIALALLLLLPLRLPLRPNR